MKKIGVLVSPVLKAVDVFDEIINNSGLNFQFAQNDSSLVNTIKTKKKERVDRSVIKLS